MRHSTPSIYCPTAVLCESLYPGPRLRTLEGFGPRPAETRSSRRLIQAELGTKVGVSNRVIAYYEGDEAQPPGAMLVDLAKALKVSADELLELKSVREKTSPKQPRFLKLLERVDELPPADQRAVLKFVDVLVAWRRRTAQLHQLKPAYARSSEQLTQNSQGQ